MERRNRTFTNESCSLCSFIATQYCRDLDLRDTMWRNCARIWHTSGQAHGLCRQPSKLRRAGFDSLWMLQKFLQEVIKPATIAFLSKVLPQTLNEVIR